MRFRRILKVLRLQGSQKNFWAHFHDLCVQKWSCFLRSSDAFRKFSPCEVKSRLLRLKTKLFALEFRRILEILCLQVLQKRFWAHIHDFCVQKWSCLPWHSDAFWKFSLCEVYKKFIAHFHDLCVRKRSSFQWSSNGFLSSLPASFAEKVLGAYTRFLRPKMKQFAVKCRRILEVLRIQGLQKDFWAHFHDLCVQKRSCFLWGSDGYWKFSPCKLYEKVFGAISRLMRPKT